GADLIVNELALPRTCVPVLAPPVISEQPVPEVASEAASGARRHSLCSEHRDHQYREVPAVAGQPGCRFPGHAERPAVSGVDEPEQILGPPDMDARAIIFSQRHTVDTRDVLVDD